MPANHSDIDQTSDWDPIGPDTESDPMAAYAGLRSRCPVAYSDRFGGFWSVFKYADIIRIARDHQTFSSADPRVGSVPSITTTSELRVPLQVDPPTHTHFRNMVRPFFTPVAMAGIEPLVRKLARNMLGPLCERGQADLAEEFAYAYPARVLCGLLGLPDESWTTIDAITGRVMSAAVGEDRSVLAAANEELNDFARDLVRARRAEPRDDDQRTVLDHLLAIDDGGSQLSDDVIVGLLFSLLSAGHHSTSRATGIVLAYLASHPDLQQRLRTDRAAIPRAVDEILRLEAPVQHLTRVVARDIEVGGRQLREGDLIALMWISGNRDDEEFVDADRFIADRHPPKTLTFGHGVHVCLGAPLARLELGVAVEELLSQTTSFELCGDLAKLEWPRYGYKTVPVHLEVSHP